MIKKCKLCLKKFLTKPYYVKNGWGKFCSSKCHYLSMKTGKFVSCDQCKTKIYRNNTKINRSKSGKFFCSKSCQTKWRNKYFSGEKHANWVQGESTYRNVLMKSNVMQICRRCGKNDKRILVAHHIDKNRKNNDKNNLMWLCCNCHFLIHYDKLEEQKLLTHRSKV